MVMLTISQQADALLPGMSVMGDGNVTQVHKFDVMDKKSACNPQHIHYETDKGKHICVHIRDEVPVRVEVDLGEDVDDELELKTYA